MAMYGLAIIPRIKLLSVDDVSQKWYADDGNAVGKLSNLRTVLDKIVSLGKFFGYHVKASKCQLIVKDEKLGEAQKIFANTGITTKAGARVLGSVIGTESECKKFLEFQQNEPIKILKKLKPNMLKPPLKTFMPAILKEFKKSFHFLPGQRLTLWKTKKYVKILSKNNYYLT